MKNLETLTQLLAQLRDPNMGCAWTKAQTLETLAPMTIAESYELLDAIATGDSDAIKKELGDILYHIVFYAALTTEKYNFDFDDIAAVMIKKHQQRMPENHQHLSAEEINQHWQQAKKTTIDPSLLTDNFNSLPPSQRALAIQEKVSEVGFDWPDPKAVIAKVREELSEVEDELNSASEKLTEELGDLLFVVINLIRQCKADPDSVLTKANQKFVKRFQQLENIAATKQLDLAKCNIEQLEHLWQQAKRELNHDN